MSAKRTFLIILDGWGLGPKPEVDAIAQADTPNFDRLMAEYPHSTLVTYGEDVGLPEGQMGNSEVGHLNIGAGRIVYQALARINRAVREGELARNEKLREALRYARENHKPLHLMGLLSDGGVHSHINHLLALIDIAAAAGLDQIYVHAFTDGRDVDPRSGLGFLRRLLDHMQGKPARLATVTGRYYAMDRDQRWPRVKLAYDALVEGKGEPTTDVLATVQERYDHNETDEFLKPIILTHDGVWPVATIGEGDVVLFFNFRTDRPRQLTRVLTQEEMPAEGMHTIPLRYLTMSRYDENYQGVEVLFENQDLSNTMGEVLARAGKTQVRIAETEKYPHVTFFFSGGQETAFEKEHRILIPSPRDVPTYDFKPEMSANEVTVAIISYIERHEPDFICLNYANTDMVGHTGVFEAAMRAAETVDHCLGRLLDTALRHEYEGLVIADHGNSDFMVNEDGTPNTAHTTNPVPCIYIGARAGRFRIKNGKLGDIAPTLLYLMGLPAPAEMDGEVLLTGVRSEE